MGPRARKEDAALNSIVDALNRLQGMLMLVIGSLALVMLTVGGIRYVAAGGDADGIKSAKHTVKHAVIGPETVAVVLMSYESPTPLTGE